MASRSRSAAAAAGRTDGGPGPRLAASQARRTRRIVDAAVRLAAQGGFAAVRLRDVAEHSNVALGTLYKYFHSKEDILLFALNEALEGVEKALVEKPTAGITPLERVTEFFRRASAAFFVNPHFAQAVVRSMTGGPETAERIASVRARITRLIVTSLRGEAVDPEAPPDAPVGDDREHSIALTLQNVWFAALVGWSVGLHPEGEVTEQVHTAAELILKR